MVLRLPLIIHVGKVEMKRGIVAKAVSGGAMLAPDWLD